MSSMLRNRPYNNTQTDNCSKTELALYMFNTSCSFSSMCLGPMWSSLYAVVQHPTHQCCIAAMNIIHHKLCAQRCFPLKPVGCQLWTHSIVLIHGKHCSQHDRSSVTGTASKDACVEVNDALTFEMMHVEVGD